jgi:hypothetical protein
MSNAMGNFLEDSLLNHILGKSVYTPGAISVALFTDAGSLSELETSDLSQEVSGTAYARVVIPESSWTVSGGVASNNATISFPTAVGSWGTIKFMALLDASDNVLYYGELTLPVAISSNTFSFLTGAIVITIDS